MNFRTALAAIAATGLVLAPVTAQAATRASSSSVVNLAQGQGNGNGPDGVQEASLKRQGFGGLARNIWIPLLAGAAIIGFILIDDNGNVTRSPGAN